MWSSQKITSLDKDLATDSKLIADLALIYFEPEETHHSVIKNKIRDILQSRKIHRSMIRENVNGSSR